MTVNEKELMDFINNLIEELQSLGVTKYEKYYTEEVE